VDKVLRFKGTHENRGLKKREAAAQTFSAKKPTQEVASKEGDKGKGENSYRWLSCSEHYDTLVRLGLTLGSRTRQYIQRTLKVNNKLPARNSKGVRGLSIQLGP